jgi:hypothetical protein
LCFYEYESGGLGLDSVIVPCPSIDYFQGMVGAEHVYTKVHKRVPKVNTLVFRDSFINPYTHDLFVLVECFEIEI